MKETDIQGLIKEEKQRLMPRLNNKSKIKAKNVFLLLSGVILRRSELGLTDVLVRIVSGIKGINFKEAK